MGLTESTLRGNPFVDEHVKFDHLSAVPAKVPIATQFLHKASFVYLSTIASLGKGAANLKNFCAEHPGIAIGAGVVLAAVLIGGIWYLILKDPDTSVQGITMREFYNLNATNQKEYVRTHLLQTIKPKSPAEIKGFINIPTFTVGNGVAGDECIYDCGRKVQIVNVPCGHISTCWQCDDDFIAYMFSDFVGKCVQKENSADCLLDEAFFREWFRKTWHCTSCREPVIERAVILPADSHDHNKTLGETAASTCEKFDVVSLF